MVVKFTPTVINFTLIGVRSLVGAFSLVGVSAEFGTWGGMMIFYCR